jgi:hypothetical protein
MCALDFIRKRTLDRLSFTFYSYRGDDLLDIQARVSYTAIKKKEVFTNTF